MSDPAAPLAVTISGLLRGQELTGAATLTLRIDALELTTRVRQHVLAIPTLDGARMLESGALELSLDGGDVVLLFAGMGGAATLRAIGEEVARRALVLPEFTRALRGLGSIRARPGAEHDRFYRPLLEARRGAARAAQPEGARLAFDAASLRNAYARRLRDMAHERHPYDPPERRALEAEATDAAAPLFAAVVELERAQHAYDTAGDADRFARWRDWVRALQRAFERADDAWLALHPVLAATAIAGPSRWTYFFRRRGVDA